MHYLIDGHNLIARMPDISLTDPDDEVKLILRLRRWTAVSQKRQVTLFFDGGIPGGKNVKLSTPQVRVIFASTGQTADALIMSRLYKVKNPSEYLLVTSDQQIIATATARKIKHLTADKFAQRLAPPQPDTPPVTDNAPVLSDTEVAEWLAAFGPVDERALRRRPRPVPPNQPPEPEPVVEQEEPSPSQTAVYNREEPQLNEKEVDEWLALFGPEPGPQPKQPPAQPAPKKQTGPKAKRPKTPNPHNLTPDDLAAWQAFANPEESDDL